MLGRRFVRAQAGISLIELVVASAILSLVSVALLAALSTALVVGLRAEDTTIAANEAAVQLENALSQPYVEPPEYPTVVPPTRFSVSTDNDVLDPIRRQRLTVAVSNEDKKLLEVSTHKVNTSFVAAPPSLLLAQRDFRWYANADVATPVTALADENTPYTIRELGLVYRLRMSVQVDILPLSANQKAFKLQYATSSSGPWVDVGGVGSTEIWRGFDNPAPTDADLLPSVVLSGSTVPQSYEEANPSRLNPNPVAVGEWAEWDWVLEENGAPFSTNFFFRMVLSDGTALESYARLPSIAMPPPQTLSQDDYRWYVNTDAVDPVTPLATVHTPYTAVSHGLTYRLRMNVAVDGLDLLASAQAFKLQFATDTGGPWTDVGTIGSGEVWRGFDNPSVADGAALSGLLLGTSTVLETYEEANPSPVNPNAINVGDLGEWDWVVQDNGAADSTTYYFRMVKADGTVLDAYVFYPQITIPAALVFTQEDYRWYANEDALTPTTGLAVENAAVTGVAQPDVLRLRMNVEVGGAAIPAQTESFVIQYATDQGGPWTNVGPGEVWQGFANATPNDGDSITALLTNSDLGVTYEEANPSALNPVILGAGQRAEWDWVLQHNGAAGGTTYYFRMARASGAALTTYTRYPTLTTAPRTLTQQDYQWRANADSSLPGAALAAENTAHTGALPLVVFRLRMNVEVEGRNLSAGDESFKLQHATSTSGPWTDVGAASSSAIWRGFDNSTPADGAAITPILTTSDIAESYEEENPSVANPATIAVGQRGEWDWVVQNNTAPEGTYYFRMVLADGTPLDGYSATYPEIVAQTPTLTQRDYQWRANADSLVPGAALAAENTAYPGATPQGVYRLRMNVEVGNVDLPATGAAFVLQFATDTGGPWTDVGAPGSGVIWRGFDNPTPIDGATITTLLTTSDVSESYEEANASALNPNTIAVGQRGEWDWVLQNNTAPAGTYYFRMVRADGTPLDGYSLTYPEISTAVPTFAQRDYQWRRNADSATPGASYAAENTAYTSTAHGLVYRLRVNVELSGLVLPVTAQSFKLQYATSTSGPWADVGGIGSGIAWRGFDNPSPADGAAITPLLSTSDVGETYEEANPSALNPLAVSVGQRAEWDWVLEDNGAADSTTYYFRMVKADGTPLDSYSAAYPQLALPAARTLAQQDYQWRANADSATPGAALASENAAVTGVVPQDILRLRMNVEVGAADLLAGAQAFKLQYATNTGGPWTDVGGIGSASIWRGLDNLTPADGATITPLLTTSDVGESYEEANPSVAIPNPATVGQRAEWDWVIQNNTAPTDTYYFRMVLADGTSLDSYSPTYPEVATAPLTFSQEDYRWYANRDNDMPAAGGGLAPENTAYTTTVHGQVYRLRMNVGVGGSDLPVGAQAFKLQFATSVGGPWTDVGGIGAGVVWRGFDNPTPADGETTGIRLSTTDVGESYEEENPSVLNPRAINLGQRAEWDWVLHENGAATSTTYYFRMVKSNGAVLDAYARYPQLTTAAPLTLSQEDYRWYDNRNALTPNTPLAAENTAYTGTAHGQVYRIRMNVEVGGADLPADTQAFALQYATSVGGPWTDVGGIGSGVIWRGFDNGAPADGARVGATLLLSASTVRGSYEEANPSVANPDPAVVGDRIEWDWVVEDNGLAPSTTYYFRMVLDGGASLDAYTRYPTITTAPPQTFTQQDYRWYQNRDNRTPNTPLAAENTAIGNVATPNVYRIRMNVEVGGVDLASDAQAFVLQYATSTGGPWTDVGGMGSGAIWRGYDNPRPSDGETVAAGLLLTTSTVRGTYEEENPSAVNPKAAVVGARIEWDWVVQANNPLSETTYYFRMVLGDGTPLTTYTRYPELATSPPIIASDDFESGGTSGGTGWLGAWDLQGDAKVDKKDKPFQGTYHLRLRRDSGYAARSVNLSGKTTVKIQFWAKAKSFEGSENATFSVSGDGVNWTVINTWVNGDDDNTYHFYEFDLSSQPLSSTFFIAFEANMGDAKDRFFVDDLRIVGE